MMIIMTSFALNIEISITSQPQANMEQIHYWFAADNVCLMFVITQFHLYVFRF